MADDSDFKLLFETEKEILARRLRKLFPSRPDRESATPPPRARAPKESPPRADTRKDRPAPHRRSPPSHLLISILLHAVVLALVLPHFRQELPPPDESRPLFIRWVAKEKPTEEDAPPAPEEAPEPPEPDEADEPEPIPVEEETVPDPADTEAPPQESVAELETPTPAPQPGPVLHGEGGGGQPRESSPLGARYGERAQALRLYGGAEDTERAVAAGLEWLALHRDDNGSWDPEGFTHRCPFGRACIGSGFREYRVGVTSLALLAFLGAGVDGETDTPYRDVVREGLAFLLAEQDTAGCIGPRRGQYMYNHAIATFCLAEAAILTGDSRYRDAARRALDFSARTQQPGGGWDYTAARTLRNDLSITGWQVMAIRSARQAGLVIPRKMEERLGRYVRRAVHASGWSTYADRGVGAQRGGISIAAVGMLTKIYLGWSPRSRPILKTAKLILRHPPDSDDRLDWDRTFQSSYYWYYATLALFHVGDEYWEAWNIFMKRTLLPLQNHHGHKKGSWDPDPNWIGQAGGRITSTALHVLMFEIYYRYDPLYRRFGHAGPDPRGGDK